MSTSSYHESSHEATSSEHGISSPAVESLASESPAPEAAQPATGSPEAEADSVAKHPSQAKHGVGSRPGLRKRQRQASGQEGALTGGLQAYRDLLNRDIEHAAGLPPYLSDPLPPSWIRASFWSSDEKDALFRELAVCDAGNLRTLATAVGTKSEAECHVYLRLLQEGTLEASVTRPASDGFSLAVMPSAVEISEQCEIACTEAAEQLSQRVERREQETEKARRGELWLINEELASVIEQQIREQEGFAETDEATKQETDGVHAASQTRTSQDADQDGSTESPLLRLPSARIIQPAAFLQLSERLFMNGPPGTESNWQDLIALNDDYPTPAMYRSAFDDFYNLTISLTRRLVQASLFQAMSRLRAGDSSRPDWQPKAEVKDLDVQTALAVLGMNADRPTYWATVARRCGVDVYSDSKKYHTEGRARTKNGVKLTYEEVESELGLQPPVIVGESLKNDQDHRSKNGKESEELELESDVSTLESDPGSSSSAEDFPSDDDSTNESQRPSKRRKRAMSVQSHERTEDEDLEAMDRQASLLEEHHLQQILGLTPGTNDTTEINDAQRPKPKHSASVTAGSWRATFDYQAEWERFQHPMTATEFERMRAKGDRRRSKRREVRVSLVQRLRGADQPINISEQDAANAGLETEHPDLGGGDSRSVFGLD